MKRKFYMMGIQELIDGYNENKIKGDKKSEKYLDEIKSRGIGVHISYDEKNKVDQIKYYLC